MDGIGFAYFRGWRLDTSVTISWDRCRYGDLEHGHILGLPDQERCARLRDELWRESRRQGLPAFACTWTRAMGSGNGAHIHLGLWSAGHPERWANLLERLTGIAPTSKRLKRGHVVDGEDGRWAIVRNTDPFALRGALGWGAYQLDQEKRHPLTAGLEGKSADVSRDLSARKIAPHREAFKAWKREVGWDQLVQEAHQRFA
jgi:hypothetical protein